MTYNVQLQGVKKKALSAYIILVLSASAGAELFAGTSMAFRPQTFFSELTPDIIRLAGAFAVGAYTIGLLSLMMLYLKDARSRIVGLTVLSLYHAGISLDQAFCGTTGPIAVVFHAWLALSCMGFIFWHTRELQK